MNIMILRLKLYKDNTLVHIKLPNISPEIFQIILKYIYGGIFPLNGRDDSEIIKVMLAADEFLLQELVDYIQNYLIENKSEWMEQNFELIHRTNTDCAIYYDSNSGPRFGDDIIMHASCGYGTDYNDIRCKKARYEKKIKDTVHNFSIDDYEVFQIVKR
ncbi:BTB/POZ protein [Rhizophagus irregularis DAOM 181602=DAOM 197198]|nr:BTB/POZ protein [Rhizophagus irregularis DAOM 181602=DAOM 197198]